jgi:hypothetical protein
MSNIGNRELLLTQYHTVKDEHCFACLKLAVWNLFLIDMKQSIFRPEEFIF